MPLGLGRERAAGLRIARRERRQEVLRQRQDVLAAIAQRRHPEVKHVEPMVEVQAEAPAFTSAASSLFVAAMMRTSTLRSRVPPSRRNVISSSTLSSFACVPRRHLADLVEEQRPAVGRLEQPPLLRLRVGEGAALVTEELALQQVLGHEAQLISMNGRPAPPGRPPVDQIGDRAPCPCPTRPGSAPWCRPPAATLSTMPITFSHRRRRPATKSPIAAFSRSASWRTWLAAAWPRARCATSPPDRAAAPAWTR